MYQSASGGSLPWHDAMSFILDAGPNGPLQTGLHKTKLVNWGSTNKNCYILPLYWNTRTYVRIQQPPNWGGSRAPAVSISHLNLKRWWLAWFASTFLASLRLLTTRWFLFGLSLGNKKLTYRLGWWLNRVLPLNSWCNAAFKQPQIHYFLVTDIKYSMNKTAAWRK